MIIYRETKLFPFSDSIYFTANVEKKFSLDIGGAEDICITTVLKPQSLPQLLST